MKCVNAKFDNYFGETFCAVRAKPLRLVSCRMCPCYWTGKINYMITRCAVWLTKKLYKNK